MGPCLYGNVSRQRESLEKKRREVEGGKGSSLFVRHITCACSSSCSPILSGSQPARAAPLISFYLWIPPSPITIHLFFSLFLHISSPALFTLHRSAHPFPALIPFHDKSIKFVSLLLSLTL